MTGPMADPGRGPELGAGSEPQPADPPAPPRRPPDPEKGLRGIMSATLVLEAITVLLAIPVAANTGGGAGPLGIAVICLLAALLIAACAIVSKPYALQVILGLQVVMIACWLITPPLGV